MKYLLIPIAIFILVGFTYLVGGKVKIESETAFLSLWFIALALCIISLYFANGKEQAVYYFWLIATVLPSFLLILIVSWVGKSSFLPWYYLLWDFFLPIVMIITQIIVLILNKKLFTPQ